MTCLWKSANNADSHKPLGFAAFPTGPTAGMQSQSTYFWAAAIHLKAGDFLSKEWGDPPVFGRICVWAQACRLGDMAGPVCMLDVPGNILRNLAGRLDSLDDPALADISDRDAFDLLESASYGCLESRLPVLDIESFDKFDFLTNAGESFDGTISFVIGAGDYLRLLFTDEKRIFHAARVEHSAFIRTVTEFLRWMDEQVGIPR